MIVASPHQTSQHEVSTTRMGVQGEHISRPLTTDGITAGTRNSPEIEKSPSLTLNRDVLHKYCNIYQTATQANRDRLHNYWDTSNGDRLHRYSDTSNGDRLENYWDTNNDSLKVTVITAVAFPSPECSIA